MARRKQAALDVPASAEEAQDLIALYVEGERAIMRIALDAEMAVDRIKASRDQALAQVQAEQATRFARLKAWWEAGGHEIAKDHRSAELAGAKLGIRLTPPKVKFARGVKAEAVVTWLRRLRWSEARNFLRTKVELDKPAIIKAVQADDHIKGRFAGAGVTVAQDDEFFIDCGLDEDALRSELTASHDAATD